MDPKQMKQGHYYCGECDYSNRRVDAMAGHAKAEHGKKVSKAEVQALKNERKRRR